MRRLPPVNSPLGPGDVLRGALAALGVRSNNGDPAQLERMIAQYMEAQTVVLCDSGTSALVAALELVARDSASRIIACPAYICVDVGAAALKAGVQIVLYDTDPKTLSPDMESLERVVRAGCSAVLIAHLYGFPVALDEILSLCRAHGVTLIEDAAQESGAKFRGRRAGSFGDVRILSFGRGKGATGGGGGALLLSGKVAALSQRPGGSEAGWKQVALSAAQWLLARPSLYWAPLSVPSLQLGEMVYEEAHGPREMSRASVAILRGSLVAQEQELPVRRRNATRLAEIMRDMADISPIVPIEGAEPSYLRFPFLDNRSRLSRSDRVGATRGYPRLLDEEPRLRDTVHRGVEKLPGAIMLRDTLFTLPTHGMVNENDLLAIARWCRGQAV
jgi:dTDP-4-amino-4,6-dideoxygalactose transaminase